jgi:DNA-binding phage protein
MAKFTRAQLAGYMDDALGEAETTHIEQALRQSEPLRQQLRELIQERDRGDHSLGAVWRRQRLSCPTRDQLGSYLLKVLEKEQQDYIHFHLHTIACSFCQANLADLEARQKESAPQVKERRRRFFQSSAGLLQTGRKKRR